jgi:predicted O-methyltransferase YrrM
MLSSVLIGGACVTNGKGSQGLGAVKTVRHSGKLGDVVYSLPAVRFLDRTIFLVNCSEPTKLSPSMVRQLIPLLEAQPYIDSACIWRDEAYDLNLDAFQAYAADPSRSLVDCHLKVLEEPDVSDILGISAADIAQDYDKNAPWLTVDLPDNELSGRVVFARSLAHRGVDGFWETCITAFGDRSVFVGTHEEYRDFVNRFGAIAFRQTDDLLDLARVVAGGDIFVGNQSCPYAIAEGLKRPAIQEVCRWCPNCIFNRPDALMVYENSHLPLIAEFGGTLSNKAFQIDLSFEAIWRAHELSIEPNQPDSKIGQCLNFGQMLSTRVQVQREDRVHPHVPEERSHMFSAIEVGAGEVEVLNYLNALVYLLKPLQLLETGTGSGLTTLAVVAALQANGLGYLHTIDADPHAITRARGVVGALGPGLEGNIAYHLADSREFLASWKGGPFDFVFFDSLVAIRHIEFQILKERQLLKPNAVCVFHDTSRLRGRYNDDFNPEMIAALDTASTGRQWMEFGQSRGLRMIKLDG